MKFKPLAMKPLAIKPVAIISALAVTGGTAAVMFGGTPVSTAFTSQSNHTISASGATVNGSVSGGDFSVGGLTPGGPAVGETVSFNNTGNTPEEAYVKLGSLVTTHYGYDDGTAITPVAADLEVTFALPTGDYTAEGLTPAALPFVYYTGSDSDKTLSAPSGETLYTANLGELAEGSGQWVDVATLATGQSVNESVYLSLAPTTGDSWNGASVQLPYTVQFQDTSGVDQGASPAGGVDNLNGGQQVDDDNYVAPSDN